MFDEAKENYKALPAKQRALIMVFVGLLPAGYIYYEEGSGLSEKLEGAQQAKIAENKKIPSSKKQKRKPPTIRGKIYGSY